MVFVEQEELALLLDHPIRKLAHFMEYMILGALMVRLVTVLKSKIANKG